MNINFELYRVFCVVAECKSITRAAEQLHISQPAISKSIKSLEKQLGGNLFIRTKRGVFLTEEGKEFYYYLKQAMEYIRNAEHKFNDLIHLESGSIQIGISTTLTEQILLPVLEEFHNQYPNINIEITTDPSFELRKKLRGGLLDLAIFNLPIPNTDDIDITPITTVHDVFVVGKKFQDLTRKNISIQELCSSYPLILQSPGSTLRNFFEDFCKNNHISFSVAMNLASYTLVVEFCKIGFGVGLATKEFIQKEVDSGELFILSTTPSIPTRQIGLAVSRHQVPNFATHKFIDILLKDKYF